MRRITPAQAKPVKAIPLAICRSPAKDRVKQLGGNVHVLGSDPAHEDDRSLILRLPSVGDVAVIAGIADALQILALMLALPTVAAQVAGVAIKLALVPFRGPAKFSARAAYAYIATVAMISLVSFYNSPYKSLDSLWQWLSFFVNLSITIYICKGYDRVRTYSRTFVNITCISSLAYLIEYRMGMIYELYGRYFYFDKTHPNLGSEINAIAAIAACMFFRPVGTAWRLALLVPPMLLMQGRAALLAALLAIMVRVWHEYRAFFRRYPVATLVAGLGTLATAAFVAGPLIALAFSNAFQLDDTYRGTASGFSGRKDLWQSAMALFNDHPIIGNGPSVFTDLDILPPHNFILIGLTSLGLAFVPLAIWLGYFAVRAIRERPQVMSIFAGVLALLMFNNRFMSSAPYPFFAYAILFGMAARPLAPATSGYILNPDENVESIE